MRNKLLYEYVILLCGIIFIISAVLKIIDFEAFALQVSYYGIVRKVEWVRWVALGTIGLELILGFSLFFQVWLKPFTIPATLIVLLGYTCLVLYAWVFQGLKDCGCFGLFIKISPLVTMIKNLIIFLFLGYAYNKLFRVKEPFQGTLFSLKQRTKILLVLFPTIIGLCFTGLSLSGSIAKNTASENKEITNAHSQNKDRPFADFQWSYQGKQINLGTGTYFVALLSTTCPICAKSVHELNELAKMPDFLVVVGLCMGDESTLVELRKQNQPKFPLFLIDHLKFMEFIDKKPPRFILVHDGKDTRHWDNQVPSIPEILEAMAKISSSALDRKN